MSEAGNSERILKSLSEIAGAGLVTPPPGLAARMEADPLVKSFVLNEVQLVRRLNRFAIRSGKPGVDALVQYGIRLRLNNDWRALASGDGAASKLAQIRRALTTLNRPAHFAMPAGALKRLTLLEREEIAADALEKEELEVTILHASLDLIPPPGQPALPVQPPLEPPTQPSVPKKVKSRSEAHRIKAQIASYKTDVEAWKKAWEKYKKDVAQYKESTIPSYVARMGKLREAYGRRVQARQSYAAYLSYRRPSFFTSESVAQRLAAQNTAYANQRLQAAGSSGAAAKIREKAEANRSASSSSSTDDWFFFWFLHYNTLHPYYAIHPYSAHAVYYHDQNQWTPSGSSLPPVDLPADMRQQMDDLNQQFTPPNEAAPDIPQFDPSQTPPDPDRQGALQIENGTSDFADLGRSLDVNLPDLKIPEVQIPDIQIPDIQIPDVPDIQIPDVQMPDVQMPTVEVSTPTFDSSPSSFD